MKEPRTHCTNRFKDFILISKGSQGAVAEPVGVCVCVCVEMPSWKTTPQNWSSLK